MLIDDDDADVLLLRFLGLMKVKPCIGCMWPIKLILLFSYRGAKKQSKISAAEERNILGEC